jgi:hypothetical protein
VDVILSTIDLPSVIVPLVSLEIPTPLAECLESESTPMFHVHETSGIRPMPEETIGTSALLNITSNCCVRLVSGLGKLAGD